ncbi:MAG: hypothetical protein MZV63_23625 [Marinilabiliales bacterium]|nr:hypothetical protein [Marinilabiliales bacterium]
MAYEPDAWTDRRRPERHDVCLPQPGLRLPAVPLEPRCPLGVQAGLVPLRRLVTGSDRRGCLRRVADEQPRCAAPGPGGQRVPREEELLIRVAGACGSLAPGLHFPG